MASAQRLLLIGLVKNPFKLKSNRDFFFTYLEKQFEPFRGSTMSSCFLRSVTWGNWDNFLSQTRSTVLEQQPDSRGLGGRWSLPSWKQLVRTCHSDIISWQLWFEYENHSWTVSSVLRCSQPLEPNTDKYTSTQPFDVTKADWYLQLCPGSIGHVDNAGWAFGAFFFFWFFTKSLLWPCYGGQTVMPDLLAADWFQFSLNICRGFRWWPCIWYMHSHTLKSM